MFVIVAPVVAILIATVVFAWQKKIERQSQLLSERRAAYNSFLAAALKLRRRAKRNDFKGFTEAVDDFLLAYYSLILIAPEKMLHTIIDCEDAMIALRDVLKNSVEQPANEKLEGLLEQEGKAFFDLFFEMRKDISNHASTRLLSLREERNSRSIW